MSRPYPPRHSSSTPFVRVNGKIRAREVRVIGLQGEQVGVISLGEAISMARSQGVDLVEIAPNAVPPVCKLVDFGKYRYEQAKRDKEAKKHQHANKVKEIQLSANIDPHDFSVKMQHAVEFLCEDMKVKVTLRFRGREMAHQEYGYQKVNQFIKDIAPFGHPDADPKLIGRGINVMFSPLPRNKRAKNPYEVELNGDGPVNLPALKAFTVPAEIRPASKSAPAAKPALKPVPTDADQQPSSFGHNPFADLDLKVGQ